MSARIRAPRTQEPARLTVRAAGGLVTVAVPAGTSPARLRARLARWLRGHEDAFDDLPLPPGTPFQRACWRACRSIPRGQVRTYAWLAARAGRPGAARAAGQAMRRNPMPIVVPCHRVVGAGSRLGGYAGAEDGASDRVKRALQSAEARAARLPCPSHRSPRA
jgi:methylated-DNA-[protein]-cysteine S-methyltransferase